MRIKTLDIYGYGKWINKKFDFNSNLQIIYGRNEAGKSTLQSFIRSILFGFPSKRRRVNQINRYEPRQGDVYGGRILVSETEFGDLWIERTLNGLKITTTDGELLPNHTLDQILGGLDEQLFDNFYSFNLQNMQDLANIGADQLNEYFLSISTIGSDKFLKLANKLEKETDELYRPQAQNRPLNIQLNEYAELKEKLNEFRERMGHYDELIQKHQESNNQINQFKEESDNLTIEIRRLEKLVDRYDIYLKNRSIQRELEGLIYTDIPKGATQKVSDAKRQIKESNDKIIQLTERLKNAEGELGTLTQLDWANDYNEDRKRWMSETQVAKETQTNLEKTEELIEEQKESMRQLCQRSQFDPSKIENTLEYQEKMDSGLEIQANKIDKTKEIDSLKSEINILQDQRKEQQNYSSIVRQQLVALESQRVNEEELLLQETSLKQYFFGIVFLVTGLCLLFYQVLSSTPSYGFSFILGLIISAIGLASIVFIYLQHKRKIEEFAQSPILQKMEELKYQEESYLDQSRQMGISINDRNALLEGAKQELNEIILEQRKWLKSIGFQESADSELILKVNPVKQYFIAEEKLKQLKQELENLNNKMKSWRSLVQPLFERFPLADQNNRVMIRHVEEIEATLIDTQQRGKSIQERIDSTEQRIQEHKENNNNRILLLQSIYKETDSKSEEEFDQKVEVNNHINELKEQSKLYLEQIVGYEDELAQISDKQMLVEQVSRLEEKRNQIDQSILPLVQERANIEVNINHLEEDGSYQELIQTTETKKSQVKELMFEWGHKRLAMELIYQTLKQGVDNPVPEMKTIATKIFEKLSFGRYTDIRFNKNGVKVKQFSDILFEPHELSQGTLEQLYVALRFAFVESASEMVKMPIIIDDAFVNFDEYRKSSMYQVIEEFSKSQQILFFTFDQQAKESFSTEQQIDLEKEEINLEENIKNE